MLQVQLAAERTTMAPTNPLLDVTRRYNSSPEDPDSEWARAKEVIRAEIGEIPFANWFACSRQTDRDETSIAVEVPSAQTREFIEMDYLDVIAQLAQICRMLRVDFLVRDPRNMSGLPHVRSQRDQPRAGLRSPIPPLRHLERHGTRSLSV
jgi:chromosomal replication initiation ATPase DnaA